MNDINKAMMLITAVAVAIRLFVSGCGSKRKNSKTDRDDEVIDV